jgi:hypothetical protein
MIYSTPANQPPSASPEHRAHYFIAHDKEAHIETLAPRLTPNF